MREHGEAYPMLSVVMMMLQAHPFHQPGRKPLHEWSAEGDRQAVRQAGRQ